MPSLKDHLAIRQADMAAERARVLRHPRLSLRHQVDKLLRGRGQRLIRTVPTCRHLLGEYYLLDLLQNDLLRTHVNLDSLAYELGLSDSSGVNCVVSTIHKEMVS